MRHPLHWHSFDVSLVEDPINVISEPHVVRINTERIEWSAVFTWSSVREGYAAIVLLGVVGVLYAMFLATSLSRGNYTEARKHAHYYDFWREQRTQRLAAADRGISAPVSRSQQLRTKATFMIHQHRLVRIFFQRNDATLLDPS